MKLSRHRWTLLAVIVWALALGMTSILAPVPAQADATKGWMTYAPNHPHFCVPLPWDCYVIVVTPPEPE